MTKKKIKAVEKILKPSLETSKSTDQIRQTIKNNPEPNVIKLPPKIKNVLPSDNSANSNVAQFSAFASTIYDQDSLGKLIDQLSLVERSLFKDRKGYISVKASDYLSGNLISIFQELEKSGLEPFEDQKQLEFLKDLSKYLLSLPVVKVTLAFEPTQSYVMRLNNQISTAADKKIVLGIIIDKSVIGGAIFEHHGKISDMTLKNKLQDVLIGLIQKAYTSNSESANK